MTRRQSLSSSPDSRSSHRTTGSLLRALHNLGHEAHMLKARIESAQQQNGEPGPPPGTRIVFRVKPDRRRENQPLGPEGERRGRTGSP